jgi:hypothetical protein
MQACEEGWGMRAEQARWLGGKHLMCADRAVCVPIALCQQQNRGSSSKAAHRALQAEKMELRNSLIAQLEQELFTGADLLQGASEFASAAQAAATRMIASDAAVSSSTVTVWTTPVILVNASACYQAAYA